MVAEGRVEVAGRAALGADPRQQERLVRHQIARAGDGLAAGGRADDRADRREPALADVRVAPAGDELGDPLPQRRAVREHGLLDARRRPGSTCG